MVCMSRNDNCLSKKRESLSFVLNAQYSVQQDINQNFIFCVQIPLDAASGHYIDGIISTATVYVI